MKRPIILHKKPGIHYMELKERSTYNPSFLVPSRRIHYMELKVADVSEVTIRVRKITFNELVELVRNCDTIVNFIRHPPTNQLLSVHFKFTTGTEYRLGGSSDKIFVVGLKSRAPTPGQDVNVTIDDLLILAVDILSV
jgi:hypothetical protein